MPQIYRRSGSGWQLLRRASGVSGEVRRWNSGVFPSGAWVPLPTLRHFSGGAWQGNALVEFPSVAAAPTLISVSQPTFLTRVVDWSIGTWTADPWWFVEGEFQVQSPNFPSWTFLFGFATGYNDGTTDSGTFDLASYDNTAGDWYFRARYRYRDALDQSAFTPWAETGLVSIV
jgi:hypothetical protein